jgi:hypothetical protein
MDIERGQILAYRDANVPQIDIARKISRDPSVISRFLASLEEHGRRKRPGRPRKLSARAERRLILAGMKENQTANQTG